MCNWMHQEGGCIARAERAMHAFSLCCRAGDTIRELERKRREQQGAESLDLFAQPVEQEAIDFWWTVHKACGQEYRRIAKLFWTRCQHAYVYRPLQLEGVAA